MDTKGHLVLIILQASIEHGNMRIIQVSSYQGDIIGQDRSWCISGGYCRLVQIIKLLYASTDYWDGYTIGQH